MNKLGEDHGHRLVAVAIVLHTIQQSSNPLQNHLPRLISAVWYIQVTLVSCGSTFRIHEYERKLLTDSIPTRRHLVHNLIRIPQVVRYQRRATCMSRYSVYPAKDLFSQGVTVVSARYTLSAGTRFDSRGCIVFTRSCLHAWFSGDCSYRQSWDFGSKEPQSAFASSSSFLAPGHS